MQNEFQVSKLNKPFTLILKMIMSRIAFNFAFIYIC